MGGGIGNGLFFLISGYLFSFKKDVKRDVLKRYIRLFIPAYIMIIITALFGLLHVDNAISAIRVFVWPTQFWFVGAIFAYSALLYVLIQKDIGNRKNFLSFTVFLILVDLILYVFCIPDKSAWIVEDAYILFIPFRCIYCLFIFVLGYYLKVNKQLIERLNRGFVVISAVITFILFYGFKFLLNKGIVPMGMQIFSQPLTVICALCIFLSFAAIEMNPKWESMMIGSSIKKLAMLSLETYLVQFLIIAGISSLNIVFPINMFICIVMTFISAWVLHWIDTWILNKLMM